MVQGNIINMKDWGKNECHQKNGERTAGKGDTSNPTNGNNQQSQNDDESFIDHDQQFEYKMESKILMDKDIDHDILELNEEELEDEDHGLLDPGIKDTLYRGTRTKQNTSMMSKYSDREQSLKQSDLLRRRGKDIKIGM